MAAQVLCDDLAEALLPDADMLHQVRGRPAFSLSLFIETCDVSVEYLVDAFFPPWTSI